MDKAAYTLGLKLAAALEESPVLPAEALAAGIDSLPSELALRDFAAGDEKDPKDPNDDDRWGDSAPFSGDNLMHFGGSPEISGGYGGG